VSTNANELIVLSTRALSEADRDYAVSFAVPIATPGLTLLASAYDSTAPQASPVEHPISARHKMMETTTVFEDEFVPWERLYVNIAKYHFAHGYHEAVRNVQDIAGGSLVTGPGAEDLAEDQTARYYERLYVGRASVSGWSPEAGA
jgi:aromatic ring hydroxylase